LVAAVRIDGNATGHEMSRWRLLFGGSERRVVERGRVRPNDVVVRAILIVAMDLIAVMGFEEKKDLMKEVEDLDGGLSGQRRQTDEHRAVVGAHGGSG
jgi:hypothetical protein